MQKRQLIWIVLGVVVLGLALAGSMLLFARTPTPLPPAGGPPPDMDTIQAQIEAGDYQNALSGLEQLVVATPDDAEAHFQLGIVAFNLGQLERAETAFRRTLELDPSRSAPVHHNLGALAYQQGEMDVAIQEFLVALDADPNDADTHYQLGATYLQKAVPTTIGVAPDADFLAQAVAEFQQSLAIAPNNPQALIGMGNVYLLEGNFAKAVGILEPVVEENPTMPEALLALGTAYASNQQTEEARAVLERFLETNPPAAMAQQARNMLTNLEQ